MARNTRRRTRAGSSRICSTGVISGTPVGGVGAGDAVIRVTDTLTRTHDTTVTWTLASVPGAVDLFTSAGYWANEGMQ